MSDQVSVSDYPVFKAPDDDVPAHVYTPTDPPPDDDFEDLDGDFAPRPRQRLGKLTVLLVALVLIGAGVLGGIELNKHQGSSSTATGAGAFRGAAAAGGAGGTGRGEGFTGGGAGFGGGTGTGTGTGAGTGTTTASPVAVGTVVSVNATTLVLKNLGGTQVTVTLTATTTITKAISAPELAAGQTVSVYGTTAAATNITIR